MRRRLRPVHSVDGTRAQTSLSICTGSCAVVKPRRRVNRVTWVSTGNPGTPYATPRTTFAVLRPTPRRVSSSSIVRGTSPPNRATTSRLISTIERALARKNPMEWIRDSTSESGAEPRASGVGNRAKSAGVVRLTRTSVHWALRMVATSNSHGDVCRSAHSAGYSRERSSAVRAARFSTPGGWCRFTPTSYDAL